MELKYTNSNNDIFVKSKYNLVEFIFKCENWVQKQFKYNTFKKNDAIIACKTRSSITFTSCPNEMNQSFPCTQKYNLWMTINLKILFQVLWAFLVAWQTVFSTYGGLNFSTKHWLKWKLYF